MTSFTTPFSTPVGMLSWTRVRIPRLVSTVAKCLYASTLLAVPFLLLDPEGLRGMQVIGFGMLGFSSLSSILFLASYILGFTHTAFPGSLQVEGGALRVGNDRVVPLSEIDGALVVERTALGMTAPTVEIQLVNGDRLTARFSDPLMAKSLVDALGFGPRGRRVRMPLAAPMRRLLHLLYGGFAYVIAVVAMALATSAFDRGGGGAPWYAIFSSLQTVLLLGLYSLIRRLFEAPTVTVGHDGVRVERGFRTRFLPLRGLSRGLVGFLAVDGARREALERLAAERAGPTMQPIERRAAFLRDAAPITEWRARLAQVLVNASYRGAPVTADDARTTLASAEATPEERVGAALALRASGEPPERIRVAAEAFADPRLRVAVLAIADGDDDRADDALRKMVR